MTDARSTGGPGPSSVPFGATPLPVIRIADEPPATTAMDPVDPGAIMLTCANCGAQMDERKCKLICRCGYFLSCSDYY